MKNFNLFTLLVTFTIVFSSCSTNETALSEEQPIALLKTYTISRDANGAYSLAFDLNGDSNTETIVDESTNMNKIFLYPSDQQTSRKATQNLVINGSELKIGFVDTNSSKHSEITIKDKNASFAKNSEKEMLSAYSIVSNEDGTYTLDFSVNNKVNVDFVFNEDLKIYEIHLEKGKANETSFSKVLEKEDGEPLKIDFVNHILVENTSAKTSSEVFSKERRPEVIIN
jgi:hypothetical protein